ncbi:MAG: beta galactosidase jelly roll domain-containing protein [Spirochaetales bacterium]|nr:beta galactosidase jelly roll domain-containing protein [Spirochaetales bacterium]
MRGAQLATEHNFFARSGGRTITWRVGLALWASLFLPALAIAGDPDRVRFTRQDQAAYADPGPIEGPEWETVRLPHEFQGSGIAWYRLHVELEHAPSEPMALTFGAANDADSTFLNGQLIGSTGRPESPYGRTYDHVRVYPIPPGLLGNGQNTIAIRVVNPYGRGGLVGPIHIVALADADGVYLSRFRADNVSYVFGTVFAAVGVYFLFLWGNFRAQKENLFFGLFALAMSGYRCAFPETSYRFIGNMRLSQTLEYAVLFSFFPVSYNFLVHFLGVRKWLIIRLYEWATLLAVVALVLSPDPEVRLLLLRFWQYSAFPVAVSILLLVGASYRAGNRQARYVFYGTLVMIPASVNDVLGAMDFIDTPRLVSFAFLIFLAFLAIILSERYLALYDENRQRGRVLAELDARRTGFLTNISHELKTPLTAIMGYSEMLEDGSLSSSDEVADAHAQMRAGARRLREVVDDTMLVRQLEEGAYRARYDSVDLASLVDRALDELAEIRLANKIDFLASPSVKFPADALLLERLMYHLLRNAMQHGRRNGQVRLDASIEGGLAIISVEDDGEGFPPDFESKAFEKFARADTTDTYESSGTGIGLALCRLAAGCMGGSIRIASSEPGHTRLELRIPFARSEAGGS